MDDNSKENASVAEWMIKEHRQVTFCDRVKTLSVNLVTLHRIRNEHLNMSKVCACWMPKMLTPKMKKTWV